MAEIVNGQLDYLQPAAARLGRIAARPRRVAAACIVTLTALGWGYLAVLQAGRTDIFTALCEAHASRAADIAPLFAMWGAMVLAMMLPSAAPMILTYAEIADTAARQRQQVVSPLVLAAGYLAVWIGFAALAGAVQLLMSQIVPAGPAASAALFLAAGLYQFSKFKQACLHKCQHPFPFFFANWRTTPRGVFGLGLRQGLYCLGCCWAAMAVMAAAGAMNIVWMAALGVLMTAEKLTRGVWFARTLGAAFLAIGAAFLLEVRFG
jgi:predicted metal-binding membrane protein